MTLDRPTEEDGPDLILLWQHPRVIPTLWPFPEPPSDQQVLDINRRSIRHWERHGFGPWMLHDSQTAVAVRRGGLQHTHVAGRDEVEVAWAIMPERWGEGLATELALTSIAVAFTELGLTAIVAFTLPNNIASRRVMEKAGFAYEQDTTHVGLPHVLYRVRAEGRTPGGAP